MRTMGSRGVAMCGVLALLMGCATGGSAKGGSEISAAPKAMHQHGMGMNGDMCPMQVAGTTVKSEDIDGGIAVAFTTSTGDVAELRRRVQGMAEMHNSRHATGGMRGSMMAPAATAVAEDVAGGARISLNPKDPAQLEALRQHVRKHAELMARGECPMMMMAAEPPPTVDPAAEKAMSGECEAMKEQKQKMKEEGDAQAAALTAIVAKMNAASRETKPGLTAEVVTLMVQQKLAMDAKKAKMEEEMMKHMMKHMQLGKESMAKCPMMKKSDLAESPGGDREMHHAEGN